MTRSPFVAAFPMYQRFELRPAFDALWTVLRDDLRECGIEAPEALTVIEGDLLPFWRRSDLLLSQTCGYPYRHFLTDSVTLVGTPDFGLPGCGPGYYRSALVVRQDDHRQTLAEFNGATIACNDVHSQSGYAAPMVAAQRANVRFGAVRISGAHVGSAQMVISGEADIAGLDAVSWRHMTMLDNWSRDLLVLQWTEATPGLPFITAIHHLAKPVNDCLVRAIDTLPIVMRELLTLKGIVNIVEAHYREVADPATEH